VIRVLIVEDDPMVAEFNKIYLERVGGFELTAIASNSRVALEFLKIHKVDLVLLDIYMPGMNGLELLTQIREAGRNVDVIVISAARDVASIKKVLQYGAMDYLIKPFEFDRFKSALTAYREGFQLTINQEKIDQKELDRLLLHKDQHTVSSTLPKGLTKVTLKQVWENILEFKQEAFTTEELAAQIGISRVSLRKYLTFLNEIGVLDIEASYGIVGRPVYQHTLISSKLHLIKSFL
jgi:two-component system, CitB family, response regulator MalR